jgi:signal transduction histidine kinase
VNVGRGDACIIALTDTGVDINADDMKRLFRPFSQIDKGLAA